MAKVCKHSRHGRVFRVQRLSIAYTQNRIAKDTAIFGAVFAVLIKLSRVEEHFISPAIEDKISLFKTHPLFEKALEQFSAGNLQEAKFILQDILKDQPLLLLKQLWDFL